MSTFATAVAERLEAVLGMESEHYLLAAARVLVARVPAPALAAQPTAAIPILPGDDAEDAGEMTCGPCP
jgi:hypothetical protein